MEYLSNLTGPEFVSWYIFLGVIHSICMLRVSGGVSDKTEAFWLVFMLTIVFPIAAAYSAFWIISNTLFIAVGNQAAQEAAIEMRKNLAEHAAENKAKEAEREARDKAIAEARVAKTADVKEFVDDSGYVI